MKKFILIIVLIQLISCGESVQDDSKMPKKKVEAEVKSDTVQKEIIEEIEEGSRKIVVDTDSLIKACEKHIVDSYHLNIGDEEFGKDIQVKGSVTFENEDYLILGFEEIIEYGSWNYTSSSMFFNKSRGNLELMNVDSKKDEKWEITINLNYKGRVNGILEKQAMLNGNDLNDIIMFTSQTFRTNESNWQNIYELDLENNKLRLFDLSTHSMITVGECEGSFGTIQKLNILDTKSDLPILEIQNIESECIEGQVKVNEIPNTQFQWDPNMLEFLLIQQ